MRFLLLGAGLQGKAVLHDLSRCQNVDEIVCVDIDFKALNDFNKFLNMDKIKLVKLDINDRESLISLMKNSDVTIDLLPAKFLGYIIELAIETRVNIVNTMYSHMMPEWTGTKAEEAGITIMPEAGLDPGIDLVLCGYGVSQLDEVHELHSYCGGFPEKKAANNPLKYKISWTWDGVLLSYKRPAKLMKNGNIIDIPAEEQHAAQWTGSLDFPGVGQLEVIPNGNAITFAKQLGILDSLKEASRSTLRWPGHSVLWKALVDLKFLSDEPVGGLNSIRITPYQFMSKHLEPQLQYDADEQDVVAMRNTICGLKDGAYTKITYDLLDLRDLETGLFSMNRTVGYTASVVAQMIANGTIRKKGLLSPIKDIPYKALIAELRKRGIIIKEKIETFKEI